MSRYPVGSYVPRKVDYVYDLHTRLNKARYDEILNDLDGHFKNCYVTNFNLINHECRGDQLNYSRKFYETVFENDLRKNLNSTERYNFIASGIKSERNDLNFEKKIYIDHFKTVEKFEKRGIFLSSMRKKAYFKNTDDCKLNF